MHIAAFTTPCLLPHFHLSAPRRPRTSGRIRCAIGLYASRVRVDTVDARELRAIARDAETGDTHVLALCGLQSELISLCVPNGAYDLSWPRSAPAWPFTTLPKCDAHDHASAVLATSKATSAEHAQIVRTCAAAYLRRALSDNDILAGVVLTQQQLTTLVCIIDPASDSGACFEPDFAGVSWNIIRYDVVHPPLSAWRAASNIELSAAMDVQATEPHQSNKTSTLPTTPQTARVAEGDGELASATDFAPKARLVFGAGALDGLAIRMRDVSTALGKDEPLRVFVLSGWNEGRIQPLNIECQAPRENGHLTFVVGANVHAGSATVDVVRRAVETARITKPHVVAAIGGGAVMDGAKAVAALIGQTDADVNVALDDICIAARRGERETTVRLSNPPVHAVLISGTTAAPMASLADRALITANVSSNAPGEPYIRHSILVAFETPVPRSVDERTSIVDSRIVSPRRLVGSEAAQGGLMAISMGLDALIHPQSSPQTQRIAIDALHSASDGLLQALREPSTSDGEARDMLMRASSAAALAVDTVGAGIGLLLTMAVVDSLRDGVLDAEFRNVYVRIMVSVARLAIDYDALTSVTRAAAIVVTGNESASPYALPEWIVQRAEDAHVPQLRQLGARPKRAVARVRQLVETGALRNLPHPNLYNVDLLIAIVEDAFENQAFDL